MTKREACPRSAVHGVVWCVAMVGLLSACAESGPRLQLQTPKSPRSVAALGGGTTPGVTGSATFDAPVIDANTWSGSPIGTGTFSVPTTPPASGGPSSIAFNDPQGSDRLLYVGDFSTSAGTALALITDRPWALGTTALNGTSTLAVLFEPATGNVTAVASSGTVTLTAAGSALGQRVTGSLSAAFVPHAPQCVVDADCAAQERCQSGQCVRVTPGCTSSAQCASGEVCQSGACVPAPTGCTSNAQCGSGQVCQAGACVAAPTGCTSNAQCARGQVCQSGQCVSAPPACTSSAQCGAGQQCVSGQCVTAPSGCTSSAQCGAGQQCVSGQCVTAPSGCTSSSQCARGQVCQAGQCVTSGPVTCTPKQGSGSYAGAFGSLTTCSALGSGAVSLSNAVAALDDDQGQLALFIVDPQTQRDGLVVALTACPAAPGSTTASAYLYASQQAAGGVVLSARVPGTATIQWTQVGATLAGQVNVSFPSGGTVNGAFTVQ